MDNVAQRGSKTQLKKTLDFELSSYQQIFSVVIETVQNLGKWRKIAPQLLPFLTVWRWSIKKTNRTGRTDTDRRKRFSNSEKSFGWEQKKRVRLSWFDWFFAIWWSKLLNRRMALWLAGIVLLLYGSMNAEGNTITINNSRGRFRDGITNSTTVAGRLRCYGFDTFRGDFCFEHSECSYAVRMYLEWSCVIPVKCFSLLLLLEKRKF